MSCRLLPLWLWAAGCASGGLAVEVPWLDAPRQVSAQLPFDQVGQVVVEVRNDGTGPGVVRVEADAPFWMVLDTLQVPGGGSAELVLFARPEAYDALSGVLVLRAGTQVLEVVVRAEVIADLDGDGVEAVGAGGEDCDDENANVHAGQPEICDGLDTDCNGRIDDVQAPPRWFPDSDADGFGDLYGAFHDGCDAPVGWVGNALDCDDSRSDVHPDAEEIWYDGVDQDCSGGSDFDRDLDGYDNRGTGGTDCQDTDPNIHPGAVEVADGVDNDCDGNAL